MSGTTGRFCAFIAATATIVCLALPAAAPAATPAPAWKVESLPFPTHFVPGDEAHNYYYEVRAVDITGAPLGSGAVTLTDRLPAGLQVKDFRLAVPAAEADQSVDAASTCEVDTVGETSTVTCKVPTTVSGEAVSHETMTLVVDVKTPPSREGMLENLVTVQGAGASATTTSVNEATAEPTAPGFSLFATELLGADGTRQSQAGSHPYQFTTSFQLHTEIGSKGLPIPAQGDVKDIEVSLPPGLVGNPTATSLCTPQQFNDVFPGEPVNHCPAGSAVGTVDNVAENIRTAAPVYALVTPPGMPAQFGFQVQGLSFYIDTAVGPGPTYPIVASLRNLTEFKRPIASRLTLWGTPGDPSHDRLRGGHCVSEVTGASIGTCAAGLDPVPFFRFPTNCQNPLTTTMLFDRWGFPGDWLAEMSTSPAAENCESLSFSPTIAVQPQTTAADTPTGLRVDLHLPQTNSADQLATADLRDARVTFPQGVTINPSSATGLASCSVAEIDLGSTSPATCPDASKIGTVEVTTPLIDHPLEGSVFLASQGENPFSSLIALYLAVDDPVSGVVVKLAGEVSPDPVTGQLTTTFDENPQLPFDDLVVELFGGPRAALRTPDLCGRYATQTALRPWSAPDSGPDATPSDAFDVKAAAAGGPCASSEADLPNQPHFTAGTAIPLAGAYSSIVARASREDGSQNLSRLNVSMPKGVLAKLAGVSYCPETAIAAAQSKTNPSEGTAELRSPSCPATSKVGTVTVQAGAGSAPLQVQGNAYLAGPYRGASISLAVVTPAVAGPFDLGVVVVRIPLQVNHRSAQVTAVSDRFPTVLHGIPLDIRAVTVALDRDHFGINPTSCAPMAATGEAISTSGRSAALSDRFQVGGCAGLGFRPKLSLRLKGGSGRGAFPALTATLKARHGDANIGRASVALPHSEFLAQSHIGTVCTRVQFAEERCPAASVYGHAQVVTPLLGKPLEGPVYLRSSSHPLPDLVVALHGQLDVELVGRIDSVEGRIRTTFSGIPDAPVTKFLLHMNGGPKGLLENSRNICVPARATVKFGAQNGKARASHPNLHINCARKSRHKQGGGR